MALKRSDGEGTIYFNKTRKRYECQFYYEDPQTGQKKKKKFVANTIKIVDQRRKAFMNQMEKERAEVLSRPWRKRQRIG